MLCHERWRWDQNAISRDQHMGSQSDNCHDRHDRYDRYGIRRDLYAYDLYGDTWPPQYDHDYDYEYARTRPEVPPAKSV